MATCVQVIQLGGHDNCTSSLSIVAHATTRSFTRTSNHIIYVGMGCCKWRGNTLFLRPLGWPRPLPCAWCSICCASWWFHFSEYSLHTKLIMDPLKKCIGHKVYTKDTCVMETLCKPLVNHLCFITQTIPTPLQIHHANHSKTIRQNTMNKMWW
jgi:hypothetical protein